MIALQGLTYFRNLSTEAPCHEWVRHKHNMECQNIMFYDVFLPLIVSLSDRDIRVPYKPIIKFYVS